MLGGSDGVPRWTLCFFDLLWLGFRLWLLGRLFRCLDFCLWKSVQNTLEAFTYFFFFFLLDLAFLAAAFPFLVYGYFFPATLGILVFFKEHEQHPPLTVRMRSGTMKKRVVFRPTAVNEKALVELFSK